MNTIVSEKGQITIPKRLRDELGLIPGSVLDFSEEEGVLVARKVVARDPISAWRGHCKLPDGLSTDDYLRNTREQA